jgi:radical SAM superfamily enzyme YgiQ (UPF0313 family)
MGSPYLGQQYVAAALLADGHEVRCVDLAAILLDDDDSLAVRAAEEWGPDMIGMTLFTYNARRGYQLASQLGHTTRLLVAGGPHATVDPAEPLRHNFDVAVAGEGEALIVELARHLDGCGPLGESRRVQEPLDDLDALAFPLLSYESYDPAWYSAEALVVPGGIMSSRGCPARCTFCANYVTGRTYRWRSPESVVAEMLALKRHHGVNHFPFWDDAFTARRPRLNAVCDAILAEPGLTGATWTCITPGNMVKPRDLEKMRRAGCVAVNFGIESGDYNVLKVIQKGQRPEHVKAAVRAAKSCGMLTIVNFMFGFPAEGVEELGRTMDLMLALEPDTDFFNNRGVLVPFPGTAIYDQHHESYGFTEWWLDPAMIVDEPNIHVLDPSAVQTYLEKDPSLDLDFFHYSDEVRGVIEDCVRFKARHNQRTIAKLTSKSSVAGDGSSRELQQKAAASVG